MLLADAACAIWWVKLPNCRICVMEITMQVEMMFQTSGNSDQFAEEDGRIKKTSWRRRRRCRRLRSRSHALAQQPAAPPPSRRRHINNLPTSLINGEGPGWIYSFEQFNHDRDLNIPALILQTREDISCLKPFSVLLAPLLPSFGTAGAAFKGLFLNILFAQ